VFNTSSFVVLFVISSKQKRAAFKSSTASSSPDESSREFLAVTSCFSVETKHDNCLCDVIINPRSEKPEETLFKISFLSLGKFSPVRAEIDISYSFPSPFYCAHI